MALSRFFFATSLLLFSLLILASAGDYSYSSTPESYNPKSQDYNYGSKSEEKSETEGYSSNSYVHKSKEEGYSYTHHLDIEKSNSKEESKQQDYGYVSKSDKLDHYNSKSVDHDYTENSYGSKSYADKLKEKSKQEDYHYDSKSDADDKVKHYESKLVDRDYTQNSYGSKSYGGKSNGETNDYGAKPKDNGYWSKSDDYNGFGRKVNIYRSKSTSGGYQGYVSKTSNDNGYDSKQGGEDYASNSEDNDYKSNSEGNGYSPKSAPTGY